MELLPPAITTYLHALAREEFRTHGMADIVQLEHRNVCKDGFGDAKDVDAGTHSAFVAEV